MPKTKPPEFEDRPVIAEPDPADHFPPGSMKRAAKIFCLFLGVYVLSYIVLSPFGAYAPTGGRPSMFYGGPSHVPWTQTYEWAPPGFYKVAPSDWPLLPRLVYAPLWTADLRLWHTSEAFALNGNPHYPKWSDSNRP